MRPPPTYHLQYPKTKIPKTRLWVQECSFYSTGALWGSFRPSFGHLWGPLGPTFVEKTQEPQRCTLWGGKKKFKACALWGPRRPQTTDINNHPLMRARIAVRHHHTPQRQDTDSCMFRQTTTRLLNKQEDTWHGNMKQTFAQMITCTRQIQC